MVLQEPANPYTPGGAKVAPKGASSADPVERALTKVDTSNNCGLARKSLQCSDSLDPSRNASPMEAWSHEGQHL